MKKTVIALSICAFLASTVQAKEPSLEKQAQKTRDALEKSGGFSGAPQIPAEQGEPSLGISTPPTNPLDPTKVNAPKAFLKRALTVVQDAPAKEKINAEQGAKNLNAALKIEAERFNSLLGDKFSVSLLDTGDGLVRQFVATGVLKMNPDIYTRMESGLAAIYVSSGKINGQSRPVCYVLNNPSKAAHLWRGFVANSGEVEASTQWAASYLMAHEVGHCLDRKQREDLTQGGEWNAHDMQAIGVPVAAFNRTFGPERKVGIKEYREQQVVLYRDGALMQYQERVADAFAILWMMGNKAPNENLKPIWDTRTRVGSTGEHKAHSTLPALQKAYSYGMELKELPSMDALWALARKTQLDVGVDRSLDGNSTLVHAEAENREAAPDTKPGQISKKGVLPAVVRFDRLRKFGN